MLRRTSLALMLLLGLFLLIGCGPQKGSKPKVALLEGQDRQLLEARIASSVYKVAVIRDDGTTITAELLMNFMPKETNSPGRMAMTACESAIYFLQKTKFQKRKLDFVVYAHPEGQQVKVLVGHCRFDPQQESPVINWEPALKDTTAQKK